MINISICRFPLTAQLVFTDILPIGILYSSLCNPEGTVSFEI